MFVFPTQSDNFPAFVGLAGEFWTRVYGGADLVFDYLRGCMVTQKQLDNDITELVATLSRQLCPVYHNELWYNLKLFQSDGGRVTFNLYRGTISGKEAAIPVQTGLTGMSFVDTGLDNGTTYYYQLAAVHGSDVGPRSAEISATPTTDTDNVWVEDAVPAGATQSADGGDAWTWVNVNPTPFSGAFAHQSNIGVGEHQHFFFDATDTRDVSVGDTLFTYIYLDPINTPTEVMLQWHVGSLDWEHRAYWGANSMSFATDGTDGQRFMGPLPATGGWVRLDIPANLVGLEGSTINGMAFTLFGGRATWDRSGVASAATVNPGRFTARASSGRVLLNWTSPAGATASPGPIAYALPSNVRKVQHVTDGLLGSKVMLTNGVDFVIDPDNDIIEFQSDPFINPDLTPLPVLDSNGAVTDYTLDLWFLFAKQDWEFLYEQFGYLIGSQLETSQNYKDLITAILRGVSGATAYTDIADAIAAITDVPCVKTDGEVVEVVSADTNGKLVITDKNVYHFSAAATVIVSVGDVLKRADQMVDTIYIFEAHNGDTPALSSLTLQPSMLALVPSGPLTFSNSDVALNVTLDVDGFTKLDWSLGGDAGDVTDFFDAMHARGIARGKTLAMCMDQRTQPQTDQPTAFNLPTTINPLQFLFQNVLRYNAFVVQLKEADYGPNNLGTDALSYLRQVMPPHVNMLVVTV